MAEFNLRDKSRTSRGKTYSMVRKHTKPPRVDDSGSDISTDQRWAWLTIELMGSAAYRTLSVNAFRAFSRILIEHNAHAALENGKLIITHDQFVAYGLTGELVADAIDELEYKGLIRVQRGRAGVGTPHSNIYTLTYVGDHEGAPATNDWRRVTMEKCRRWLETDRKLAAERRGKIGRKKKSPLRDPEISPLRDPEILKAS